MKLEPEMILHKSIVGIYKDGPVCHLVTKGGYHMMYSARPNCAYELLSVGSHRAVAKHMADMKYNGEIKWDNEKLYKADRLEVLPESNPSNHMALADHHAVLHNKYVEMGKNPSKHADEVNSYYRAFIPDHKDMDDFQLKHDIHMHALGHEDTAIKNYQMAGLDRKAAYERLKSQVNHATPLNAKAPFSDDQLHRAWNHKHADQRAPGGIGYDQTK